MTGVGSAGAGDEYVIYYMFDQFVYTSFSSAVSRKSQVASRAQQKI